jgi:hypothetical protein
MDTIVFNKIQEYVKINNLNMNINIYKNVDEYYEAVALLLYQYDRDIPGYLLKEISLDNLCFAMDGIYINTNGFYDVEGWYKNNGDYYSYENDCVSAEGNAVTKQKLDNELDEYLCENRGLLKNFISYFSPFVNENLYTYLLCCNRLNLNLPGEIFKIILLNIYEEVKEYKNKSGLNSDLDILIKYVGVKVPSIDEYPEDSIPDDSITKEQLDDELDLYMKDR